MHKIDGSGIAAGTVLRVNKDTFGQLVSGAVDDEYPPVAIDAAALRWTDSIFARAFGTIVMRIARIIAGDKIAKAVRVAAPI